MIEQTLSRARFKALAEIHGGDIARWPEACRERARALLAGDPEGLGPVLAEASRLDRLLDLAPAGIVDAALLGRLIAAAPRPTNAARRWIAGLGAALGLGVAAMAGVTAGVMLAGDDHRDTQTDTVIAASLDTSDFADLIEEPDAL